MVKVKDGLDIEHKISLNTRGRKMFKTYVKTVAVRAQIELEDLLLDKATWLAVVGLTVVVANWMGAEIPLEVVVATEALIVAVILALKKK